MRKPLLSHKDQQLTVNKHWEKNWYCHSRISLKKYNEKEMLRIREETHSLEQLVTRRLHQLLCHQTQRERLTQRWGWGFRDIVILQISLLGLSLCASER